MGTAQELGLDKKVKAEESKGILTFKEKFAFFLANMGNIPLMTLLGGFLLIFYTDIVGLNAGLIGTLFLVSRVFDGVNDPIMGYVVDHLPRTKMGRFRLYLIIGTVITSAIFLAMWLGPSLASEGKAVIAFITYILFGFAFDLMDIPLNSMISVMSDRDADRNALANIKGFAYALGGIGFTIIVVPFVSSFPTQSQGYHYLIVFATAFVMIFSILGTLGIKERIYPVKEEKYSFREVVKIIGSKPVFSHFINTLLLQIGNGMMQGTQIFFFTYVLNRPDLFPVTGGSYLLGTFSAVALTPWMARKFGKKATKTYANILSVLGFLVLFFLPADQPFLFILVIFLMAPGMGINQVLVYSIQADNTDYIEWKNGYRAEGAIASVNSFIIKSGLGVGSALGAYVLALVNYVPNQVQTQQTIRGLYWNNFMIPALLGIVALFVWIRFYPLNKAKTEEMMDELHRLRSEEKIYPPEG